jgi:hypothetical protein
LRSIYRSLVFTVVSHTGFGQLGLPLAGYFTAWSATFSALRANGWASPARFNLPVLVSFTVQALYLAWRRDRNSAWWRLGTAYAILMICLDRHMWPSDLGATARVVLPMSVAFNILLARESWFWPLFVLGNLAVLPGLEALAVPLLSGHF